MVLGVAVVVVVLVLNRFRLPTIAVFIVAGEMSHNPRAFETIRPGDVIYRVGDGPQVIGALRLLAEGPSET